MDDTHPLILRLLWIVLGVGFTTGMLLLFVVMLAMLGGFANEYGVQPPAPPGDDHRGFDVETTDSEEHPKKS